MKQKLFLLLNILLVATTVLAAPVDTDVALRKALAFMSSRLAAARGGQQTEQTLQLATIADGGCYYVFNVGTDNGFVIVSGDDRTPDILGYSDSGSFSAHDIPAAFKFMLQVYASQMKSITVDNQLTSQTVKSSISPMLTTFWDQGYPYNDQCPTINGDRTETGCVATAMAQLMNYHKWPKAQSGSVPGYTTEGYYPMAVSSLPSTVFDWNNMPNICTDAWSGAEVAKLMQYCATAVRTDFGVKTRGGSGAYLSDLTKALKNYFDYDEEAQFISLKNYDLDTWIEMIYSELVSSRPVVLGGQSSTMGHAFICDGYDNGFFHINWGWSGEYNGYFRLSLLDPRKPEASEYMWGDGFNTSVNACIGIKPKSSGDDNPPYIEPTPSAPYLTVYALHYDGELMVESPTNIRIVIRNSGNAAYYGDITMVQAWNGNMVSLGTQTVNIQAGQDRILNFVFTPPSAGMFELKVYQGYGAQGSCLLTQTVVVADATSPASLVLSGFDINCDDKDMNFDAGSNDKLVYDTGLKGEVTITNNGGGIYNQHLKIQLGKISSITEDHQITYDIMAETDYGLSLAAGNSMTVDFEFNDLDFGERYLVLFTYNEYIGTNVSVVTEQVGPYLMSRYLTTIDANGIETSIMPEAAIVIPESALLVDLRGQQVVTDVTPNSNPNCLYLLDDDVYAPWGLSYSNIVRCNKGNYKAMSITLSDGYDFMATKPFTAETVSYSRQFKKGFDGHSGWETFVLPFDVDKVTVDGIEKDWFHNSTDTCKHFWVKAFVADASDSLRFDYVDKMEANTPYLIAVPDDSWGDGYDLTGKTLVFTGTDKQVSTTGALATGQHYQFVGTTLTDALTAVYVLDDKGSAFALDTVVMVPFRAYFAATSGTAVESRLPIAVVDQLITSINSTLMASLPPMTSHFYSITGRYMGTDVSCLPKGIFVDSSSRRKIVIK